MPQYASYRERSRAFLEQALDEFEAGDLVQASEKGWGAAAQMLKALAAERGWEHQTHRQLFGVLGRLTAETPTTSLRLGFRAASALHANFYEDLLEEAMVEERLGRVRTFVADVEGMLDGS